MTQPRTAPTTASPLPALRVHRRAMPELDRARMVREVVDRAKDLLMAQDGLSEPEAFRRLQTTSMNTRTPMAKVAEAVLLADAVRRPDRRP
jgi:two-component system, response regulator PdtaR